jgi:hypothetical protein
VGEIPTKEAFLHEKAALKQGNDHPQLSALLRPALNHQSRSASEPFLSSMLLTLCLRLQL